MYWRQLQITEAAEATSRAYERRHIPEGKYNSMSWFQLHTIPNEQVNLGTEVDRLAREIDKEIGAILIGRSELDAAKLKLPALPGRVPDPLASAPKEIRAAHLNHRQQVNELLRRELAVRYRIQDEYAPARQAARAAALLELEREFDRMNAHIQKKLVELIGIPIPADAPTNRPSLETLWHPAVAAQLAKIKHYQQIAQYTWDLQDLAKPIPNLEHALKR